WPATVPVPPTRPSAGVRSISSSTGRRRRWAAMASGPYSTKLPGSRRSARFSRAVRCPVRRRRATASGRASSNPISWRRRTSARSARSGLGSWPPSSASISAGSPGVIRASRSPACTTWPTSTRTSATVPGAVASTACSIFMDSMTTTGAPAPTDVPVGVARTTVPWRGDRISSMGPCLAPDRPAGVGPGGGERDGARVPGHRYPLSPMAGVPYLERVAERVVVYDGAFGTYVQTLGLGPDDFGGEAYEGCNELLCVTRPDVIAGMHEAFFEVGVDVVETASFGSFAVPLAEYGIADRAHELNVAAARIAREVADGYDGLVAGSIGPGTKF